MSNKKVFPPVGYSWLDTALFTVVGVGLILMVLSFAFAKPELTLINGDPVDPNDTQWHPVVRIKTGSSSCSATVVGPSVVLTAAHCGANGQKSCFTFNQREYCGTLTRSSLYPGQDHDMALIKLDVPWAEKSFGVITESKPPIGGEVTLLGYGCTQPGGGGGNDGVLRKGDTVVTRYSNYDVISQKSGGAALCFGDSGGPSYRNLDGRWRLWGVNSKGNISDTNYNMDLTSNASRNFLQQWSTQNNAKICGYNKDDCEEEQGTNFVVDNEMAKAVVTDKPEGHDVQFIKRYVDMLWDYFQTGKWVWVEGTVPNQQYCGCANGELAVCNEKGIGYCDETTLCSCR